MYEMGQAVAQSRACDGRRHQADVLSQSRQPAGRTPSSANPIAAACELFERTTRRYGKPEWSIDIDRGQRRCGFPSRSRRCGNSRSAACCISSASSSHPLRRPQPRVLIVAPMSGHYATLLRGTVEGFLPNHDVYITDWVDARAWCRSSAGRFDLDDYIDYVIEMLHALGGNVHVVAVCQPSVPVLAAAAVMEAEQAIRWSRTP